MSTEGSKLNPLRRFREPRAIKGLRQTVVSTHNPSTIGPGQPLTVRFPPLGEHDVIVPGTSRLTFKIILSSKTDDERTIKPNLGRRIVSKRVIKVNENEVLSLDSRDVFDDYRDLWLSKRERTNAAFQGICNDKVNDSRVKKKTASVTGGDKALADMYKNRFCIPLDFEMLNQVPFYQNGLDRLSFELTFASAKDVIKSSDTSATYKVEDICLEFEKVTNEDIVAQIRREYQELAVLYDRQLRFRYDIVNKKDKIWTINLQQAVKSLKGILMFFKDDDEFYNPKITKVTVQIDGVPNQIYANGMLPYHQFEEAKKYFGSDKHTFIELSTFLTKYYCLWIDMRVTEANHLHGSGRRVDDTISIAIEKESGTSEDIGRYIFVVMDAQINIEDGKFVNVIY